VAMEWLDIMLNVG